MKSAIQLLDYKWLDIDFHPKQVTGKEHEYTIEHAISTHQDEANPRHWYVRLDLRLGCPSEGASAPYEGELAVGGHFELAEGFPEHKATDMVRFNAGAMLYGAMRELVLTLTSRSIHGPYTLPSIDARSFLPEKQEAADENPAGNIKP